MSSLTTTNNQTPRDASVAGLCDSVILSTTVSTPTSAPTRTATPTLTAAAETLLSAIITRPFTFPHPYSEIHPAVLDYFPHQQSNKQERREIRWKYGKSPHYSHDDHEEEEPRRHSSLIGSQNNSMVYMSGRLASASTLTLTLTRTHPRAQHYEGDGVSTRSSSYTSTSTSTLGPHFHNTEIYGPPESHIHASRTSPHAFAAPRTLPPLLHPSHSRKYKCFLGTFFRRKKSIVRSPIQSSTSLASSTVSRKSPAPPPRPTRPMSLDIGLFASAVPTVVFRGGNIPLVDRRDPSVRATQEQRSMSLRMAIGQYATSEEDEDSVGTDIDTPATIVITAVKKRKEKTSMIRSMSRSVSKALRKGHQKSSRALQKAFTSSHVRSNPPVVGEVVLSAHSSSNPQQDQQRQLPMIPPRGDSLTDRVKRDWSDSGSSNCGTSTGSEAEGHEIQEKTDDATGAVPIEAVLGKNVDRLFEPSQQAIATEDDYEGGDEGEADELPGPSALRQNAYPLRRSNITTRIPPLPLPPVARSGSSSSRQRRNGAGSAQLKITTRHAPGVLFMPRSRPRRLSVAVGSDRRQRSQPQQAYTSFSPPLSFMDQREVLERHDQLQSALKDQDWQDKILVPSLLSPHPYCHANTQDGMGLSTTPSSNPKTRNVSLESQSAASQPPRAPSLPPSPDAGTGIDGDADVTLNSSPFLVPISSEDATLAQRYRPRLDLPSLRELAAAQTTVPRAGAAMGFREFATAVALELEEFTTSDAIPSADKINVRQQADQNSPSLSLITSALSSSSPFRNANLRREASGARRGLRQLKSKLSSHFV